MSSAGKPLGFVTAVCLACFDGLSLPKSLAGAAVSIVGAENDQTGCEYRYIHLSRNMAYLRRFGEAIAEPARSAAKFGIAVHSSFAHLV